MTDHLIIYKSSFRLWLLLLHCCCILILDGIAAAAVAKWGQSVTSLKAQVVELMCSLANTWLYLPQSSGTYSALREIDKCFNTWENNLDEGRLVCRWLCRCWLLHDRSTAVNGLTCLCPVLRLSIAGPAVRYVLPSPPLPSAARSIYLLRRQ